MSDAPLAKRLNRYLRLALILSLLALLGWLGWRGVRTALYARAALADLDRLQALMVKPSLSGLPDAQADLAALQTHLAEARRAGNPFLRIAPAFGWVPRFGPDLVAAPQLVDMAVEVATGARLAADALAPIASSLSGEGGGLAALPAAVDALVSAQPALDEALVRIQRAADLRATMPPLAEPRLAGQLDKVDQLLPLAQAGLALAQAAPALLGADGPKTYLILAQNNDELRATGGFISGAGHVTLDRGSLVALTLTDSYAVDNWEQPHPDPPAPLRKYMAAELWVLRDSNWSPDFPTAADVARALYAQDRGVATDGAIALDLNAVAAFVGAVGPLQVAGIAEPVTGANALQWMKAAWESPSGTTAGPEMGGGSGNEWWLKRKDFMGELVKAALARVQAGGDLDMVALARALYSALNERSLQIAVDDPTLSALLAQRGWDGGVRPPPGADGHPSAEGAAGSDFLLVLDSNLGFNKANLLVREALDYKVVAAGDGQEAALTITYTHDAPAGAEDVCDRAPRYAATYEGLAQRCYWDYLRVYVPGGSALLASEGLQSPATEDGERGTTLFTGDFVLKPGATHAVTLRYRLPATVPASPYRLFVRKQAGAHPWPLTVTAGACQKQATLTTDVEIQCEGE